MLVCLIVSRSYMFYFLTDRIDRKSGFLIKQLGYRTTNVFLTIQQMLTLICFQNWKRKLVTLHVKKADTQWSEMK